jgi:putative membrane protein
MTDDRWGRDGGMEWWQMGAVLGAVALLLVVAVVVVLVVVTLRDIGAGRRASRDLPRAPSALHGAELILAERLARGEIDETEFLSRRHVLLRDELRPPAAADR